MSAKSCCSAIIKSFGRYQAAYSPSPFVTANAFARNSVAIYPFSRELVRNMSSNGNVNGETNGQPKLVNAWSGPGVAAFDLRSDTQTCPTASMLKAIQNTTLLDDVYREDTTTNDLEDYMAARTSHEKGLFVLSGTMGNQLALRSHLTQPPHSVLCDYRGHILEWEAGGVATLCGALVKGVVPRNGNYLTLEDIQENITLTDDVHDCPTRVISLENTLGGSIMPLSEVRRISEFARAHNVKLHLDGARIWEAVAAGAGSLPEFTSCFDSVSLCFSKGLGAPVGSILVGRAAFIKHARWMRQAIGGGLRQPGVVTAAARVAVEENFGKDQNGKDGQLRRTHLTAKKVSDKWQALGGKLQKPTETNMLWLDLADAGISGTEFTKLGEERGLKLGRGRVVTHYQVSDEALEKLEEVMKVVLERKAQNGGEKIERKIGEKVYG